MITSKENPKIKELKKILKNPKKDAFLVEGFHLVEEALKSGALKEVFSLEPYPFNKVTLINEKVLKEITESKTPEGIVGLVSLKEAKQESDEIVLGHSPLSIVVSKNHPLAAVAHPTVDDLRRYRQIVVYARDPQTSSVPHVINNDHWEVDSGLWALGLAARGVGWAVLPKFLLLGQSPFKNAVVTLESPFALEAQRLVLRSKKGEVSSDILKWWSQMIERYKDKLGLEG